MTFEELQEECLDTLASAIQWDTGKPFNLEKVQQQLADLLPQLTVDPAGPKFLQEFQKFQAKLIKAGTLSNELIEQYLSKWYNTDQTLAIYAQKQWNELAGQVNALLVQDPNGLKAMQYLFNNTPKVQVTYNMADGNTKVFNWTIDNYRRRRNRDIARVGTQDVAKDAAAKIGTTYFITSSHAGARPKCYPWQNIMYDEDNKAGRVINGQYVYNKSDTSIGEPDGLFGENCGHTAYAGVPGITKLDAVEVMPEEANFQVYRDNQTYTSMARQQRVNKTKLDMATTMYGEDSPIAKKYQGIVNNHQDAITKFTRAKGITSDPRRETPFGQ